MALLRIHLFGETRLSYAGRAREQGLTPRSRLLLAYLLLQRSRSHRREALTDLFWGEKDAERGRGCLRSALHRLRRVLEPASVRPGTYLIANAQEIGFNRNSEHWLDAAVLEQAVARVATAEPGRASPEDRAALGRALALYDGDLLEGVYEDWALRERERLRLLYLSGHEFLMRHHATCAEFDKALDHGREILALDPLREEIQRDVIRLYLRRGDRAKALEQYRHCHDLLLQELGVPPMEETVRLVEEIAVGLDNAAPRRPPSAFGGRLALSGKLLERLRAARSEIEEAERLGRLLNRRPED